MAKKGVVFVSIPYRVGVFGFLAHPELSKESNGKASGNCFSRSDRSIKMGSKKYYGIWR